MWKIVNLMFPLLPFIQLQKFQNTGNHNSLNLFSCIHHQLRRNRPQCDKFCRWFKSPFCGRWPSFYQPRIGLAADELGPSASSGFPPLHMSTGFSLISWKKIIILGLVKHKLFLLVILKSINFSSVLHHNEAGLVQAEDKDVA